MEPSDTREYLDAKELASRYRISTATVWRLKRAKLIPFLQVGKHRRVLFPHNAIELASAASKSISESHEPTPSRNEKSGARPKWMSRSQHP